ncbi:epoxyqueuosine reductase QueH [Fundidesulfovibrio butyratiphilus]
MILMHACCGPCSITVAKSLMERGLTPLGFYYNPNIHPLMEYVRRRDALKDVSARLGFESVYADDEYDPALYLRLTAFREKDRCEQCYRLRLTRAAREARARGLAAMTSTLLYSRYQNHDLIAAVGREAASDQGVDFHYEDFRAGWQEGIDLSRSWGVYRQPYCGCILSEYDRYRKRLGR